MSYSYLREPVVVNFPSPLAHMVSLGSVIFPLKSKSPPPAAGKTVQSGQLIIIQEQSRPFILAGSGLLSPQDTSCSVSWLYLPASLLSSILKVVPLSRTTQRKQGREVSYGHSDLGKPLSFVSISVFWTPPSRWEKTLAAILHSEGAPQPSGPLPSSLETSLLLRILRIARQNTELSVPFEFQMSSKWLVGSVS